LTYFVLLLASVFIAQSAGVETLRSVSALPASVAGAFEEIAACHVSPDRDFIVFDRRSHSVSRVAAEGKGAVTEIVKIGMEPGRILMPSAFASAPDGAFVVADETGVERVQMFLHTGSRIGGFLLPKGTVPRIPLGNLGVIGVGSVDYTGKTVLINDPESGALISEYGLDGAVLRTFGTLRATGHEQEREVHLALNSGFPVAIPGGGFYFVFYGGAPTFRRYDTAGMLLYERHIEGPELDDHLRSLPSKWPTQVIAGSEHPIVAAAVRTAAVDPGGNLWLSLLSPVTYVYDAAGEKRRTIQFRAAGLVAPTNLHFTRDGRVIVSPGCYVFKIK
jgi:hypothetical protein